MPSILTVSDGWRWHAKRDLELVTLWQSLICYQQKHLWLIGHIRAHRWLRCVHTHIHKRTHAGVLCFSLGYECMLIIHFHSQANVNHISSRTQTLHKDALNRFASVFT